MIKLGTSKLSITLRSVAMTTALVTASTFAITTVAENTAYAQKKKKKRKKKRKKKAKATTKAATISKPGDDKPTDPFKREGAAKLKVETQLDKKKITRTKQADAKRDEAIEELKKLIPKAPKSRKAEMIFRLAELYWEKSKYRYGLEMEDYEKSYTEWAETGQRGKAPAIKDHIRQSELIKQNALKLYEKVMTEYPTYERNDEVLFYLGYNEYEAGNKKKAVGHYWTLIKQFPKSRLVTDSYLQLGEHFFNNNNVFKAQKAFERALAGEARVYNYALYKLAWCDYNVQEYGSGIKKLKEVIEKSEKKGDRKSVQLKAEALGDLARFFSYVDETDTAFAYFKKKGGEEIAYRYSTRLGQLFDEQGKWNLAIETYRMLIGKFPMNEKSPSLQANIVESYTKLNKKTEVRQEVERLVDLYRPGTPWYKSQERKGEKGKAALEYAYDLTETKLRDLVTEYHRDAQKRKDVPTYELARDIYGKYLDAFSNTDSAYQMRFFYAEVLYALKEWKNAATQYDKIARTKGDGKARGKYNQISAYNAILAWEKIVVEGAKGDLNRSMKINEKKKKGKSVSTRTTKIKIANLDTNKVYKEEAIPETEQKLSDACDLYFQIADKKDKELPAIKFKAAYLYYKHNHFVAAAERYFEIIERWPGDKLSKKSANLVLDSLNVQKKWTELEKYARSFRDNRKLVGKDRKFKEEVQVLVEGASYKSIQVAETDARKLTEKEAKESSLGEVASRFRGFQKEFPKSKLSDKALMSAVLIYNQADELDRAIEVAERLKKKYPKSEQKERNHLLLAEFNERIADFSRAAELYSEFTTTYKKSEKVPIALFNAGIYYQGLGNTKKALARFTKYYEDFGKRDDAADVYWRTCELFETDKNWKKASACFTDFQKKRKWKISKAKKFEARYRYALTLEKLKKRSNALKEYKWIRDNYAGLPKKEQKKEGAQLAAAHSAFELLEGEFTRYARMKVTLNRKTLKKKIETAEELACVSTDAVKCKKEGKFLSILSYGNGDYGICALTRMGQVYRGLADAIRNAPLPRRLTEDQKEIYRAELDAVALGPEEKAIGAFERSLDKAYELNIYSQCTLTAQDNLKQLNPNKFPDLQKRNFQGAEGFIVASVRSGDGAAAEPEPEAAPEAAPAGEGEEGDEAEGDDESASTDDGESTGARN